MNKTVLIDFHAEWCDPCSMQDPIIEELKKKFKDKVDFKKIDVDEDPELADKYNIMSVPTLIIKKDENVFKRHVGVTSLDILEKDIKSALNK